MSSSLTAGKKGTEPVERFSSPLAALGIAVSFLLLLLVLFPEKKIIKRIDATSGLSPVVLDYQVSMLRLRPGDAGLRLKLAEGLAKAGRFRTALETLDGFAEVPRKENRNRYLLDRCLVLNGILVSKEVGGADRKRILGDFSATARALAENGASPEQLLGLAGQEKNNGDVATARVLMRRYIKDTALSDDLADVAITASSRRSGNFRENAAMYFSAMADACSLKARRALFVKGVRSLQAGGLSAEALASGEEHLGVLAADRDTLLFMANIALAADRPRTAQFYVKKALGMESCAKSGEVRPSSRS